MAKSESIYLLKSISPHTTANYCVSYESTEKPTLSVVLFMCMVIIKLNITYSEISLFYPI